ncbi:5-formyltetrahydrofolate cyclo-ligase [Kwoniella bestiolae CBS 10118]|uniref:5-formyltetrahydrofolate cyclo-ligase n=1 Tax=Kwoniella bestiolae CBS 10118 TaxID=1296100 RepID=A0A1B9G7L7_9TREE|nr:5-formyltetrahydrofolate cyclo-ligase [Kwoniella bestiolae CBS 10118]OCF27018.1 5-formyltetrahydrofolate cyclo-ligase [Kwoniella bestiolae CBS 10118]
MSTQAAFALKASLRKSMLKTLKGMSDGEVEKQSQAVFRILLDQPFFKEAKSIGCYLSMKHGELRTNGIVDHVLKRGSTLYTPFIPPPPSRSPEAQPSSSSQDMKMLRLYSSSDLDKCPLDKWGILDPGETRNDMEREMREDAMNRSSPPLDLILIPGVAFDEECNRLGRGKAYYDRFLLSYTSNRPSPLLVALALSPQILERGEKVPTTEHDFRLDGVVSPEGIVWRNSKSD